MLHLNKATLFCLVLLFSFGFFSVKAQEFTAEQIADSLDYYPLDVGNVWLMTTTNQSAGGGSSVVTSHYYDFDSHNNKFYAGFGEFLGDFSYGYSIRNDSITGIQYFLYTEGAIRYWGGFISPFSDSTILKENEFPIENFMVSSASKTPLFENSARFINVSNSDAKTFYEKTFHKTDRELLFDNPEDTLIRLKQYRIELKNRYLQSDSTYIRYAYAHRIGLLYFYQVFFNENTSDSTYYEVQLSEAIIRGKEYKRSSYPFASLSIENTSIKPKSIEISAYPNPFNPQTTIRLSLAKSEFIRLSVFDVLGREIKLLFDGMLSSGSHSYAFDAGGFPSGMYVYRVEADGFQQSGKLLLIK